MIKKILTKYFGMFVEPNQVTEQHEKVLDGFHHTDQYKALTAVMHEIVYTELWKFDGLTTGTKDELKEHSIKYAAFKQFERELNNRIIKYSAKKTTDGANQKRAGIKY